MNKEPGSNRKFEPNTVFLAQQTNNGEFIRFRLINNVSTLNYQTLLLMYVVLYTEPLIPKISSGGSNTLVVFLSFKTYSQP